MAEDWTLLDQCYLLRSLIETQDWFQDTDSITYAAYNRGLYRILGRYSIQRECRKLRNLGLLETKLIKVGGRKPIHADPKLYPFEEGPLYSHQPGIRTGSRMRINYKLTPAGVDYAKNFIEANKPLIKDYEAQLKIQGLEKGLEDFSVLE